MAVLEKIRVRMGAFITVLIGLAVIAFFVDPNTLIPTLTSLFSSRNDVGHISGNKITQQDFLKQMQYYEQVNTAFTAITGSPMQSSEMADRVNEETWQGFFKEYVLYPQYEQCGLHVSPKELVNLIQGRYISPILQNDPLFLENGTFSQIKVQQFYTTAAVSDPHATYWSYIETRMHDAQLMEKYMSLITKGQYKNALDVKHEVASRNTIMDITYLYQPTTAVNDTTQVTEEALHNYYKKHHKQFEQRNDERDIQFVAFPIAPSDSDVQQMEAAMEKIYTDFRTHTLTDVVNFATRNSDSPFTGYYYKAGELPAKLDSFAFAATTRDILPVYREGNTFYTARIIKSRMLPDSVRVRHISIQRPDLISANLAADSLINVLNRGANFAYIAQNYSADPAVTTQSDEMKGDLGWIQQGLVDTCFMVPQNRLIKLESRMGVEILEVTARSRESRKVQLAIIEKTVRPGEETYQTIFSEASTLATETDDPESFDAFAAENNLMVVPANNLTESDRTITALGTSNTRDLVRWAYEAEKGAVSHVITIDNYFVVANLKTIRHRGTVPFEQVRENIENTLRREQHLHSQAQAMQATIAGAATIEDAADKTSLALNTALNLSFFNNNMTGIGREYKLQGAIAGAQENVLTGPVKGAMGIYLFTVNRRHVSSAYTAEELKRPAQPDQMTLMQQYTTWYNTLEKAANVQDWRSRFF